MVIKKLVETTPNSLNLLRIGRADPIPNKYANAR